MDTVFNKHLYSRLELLVTFTLLPIVEKLHDRIRGSYRGAVSITVHEQKERRSQIVDIAIFFLNLFDNLFLH